ncbi:rab-GTPase-TBC domain-containing protein [Zychaea mexicana]|uniref:rab-GTPase-TBC domain-containing protein n=1 Tax=Zychaea mexicana TaxID=64656 RepID=UPI0022FEA94B|nr:rab-GTPase-TBC domain-containing protein [Zychaea mexicana]KAI9497994.1 rab-GTPase-TBC domain-containing protein [Zychaea mexicana]
MALFANASDLKVHYERPTPKLASCNFVASARSSEALAQSGHLAVSAPSQIMGRFQLLKSLCHENLCEYVEIHRGKHDRLFVVNEYHDNSLQKTRSVKAETSVSINLLQRYACEMFGALSYLEQNNVVHAALSPQNVLLDEQDRIKLSGYGLYYMTGHGVDVDFPIGYPGYLAPECVLDDEGAESSGYDKRDCWAVGIILVEQFCRNTFWTTSDVGLIFDTLSTLADWAKENEEDSSNSVWYHQGIESLDINKDVLSFLQGNNVSDSGDSVNAKAEIEAFRELILMCLQVSHTQRPYYHQILALPFLSSSSKKNKMKGHDWVQGPILASQDLQPDETDIDRPTTPMKKQPPSDPLADLPLSHIYHLWRLAGGDVEVNLVKRGVFLSVPVIERLPRVCFIEDAEEIGPVMVDTTQLYSDTMHILSFKELYQRLEQQEQRHSERFEWDADYFNVVDENDVNFLLKETDKFDNLNNNEGENEDFVFDDEISSPHSAVTIGNGPPSSAALISITTPTTPSTSRSLNRTFSLSSMNRSRSSSSISVGTPAAAPSTPTQSSIPRRPLSLREQDVNYQYHRQRLFAELLRQYPASQKEILHHAKVDIPPLLRNKIWAAILDVHGDVETEYQRIDKYNDIASDRQIDVDVPRCHQYNQLLASSAGHEKLRRLLKSWVSSNKKWVYWQGLDSLCAPFLTLNFNDEALAFACLQKFILKFLNNFFLRDNSAVLQDYFAVFRHVLSFHDPELSAHIDAIGFVPDLYAIRWFLTLFTHVFPLDKVYHLWDKFMVGPPSLPLFVGVAILRQIRDELLKYEFNGCISLFSEHFPKIDIEGCIQSAMKMCKVTPPSVVSLRPVAPLSDKEGQQWWEKPLPIDVRKQELAPRIDIADFPRISPYTLVLDIRSDHEFVNGHLASSMNVQPSQLHSYASILRKLNRKYHVIVADDSEKQGPEFAAQLVQNHHFPRTAVLQGGIEAAEWHYNSLGNGRLCTCRPQKQTTAGYKGKGSEPPFVIWRCKVPTPLSKR